MMFSSSVSRQDEAMICCGYLRVTAVTRARKLNMFFEDGQRPTKLLEMQVLFQMLRAAEVRSDRGKRMKRVKRICNRMARLAGRRRSTTRHEDDDEQQIQDEDGLKSFKSFESFEWSSVSPSRV